MTSSSSDLAFVDLFEPKKPNQKMIREQCYPARKKSLGVIFKSWATLLGIYFGLLGTFLSLCSDSDLNLELF